MKRKSIQTVFALLIVSFLLTAPRAQQTPPAAQSQEDRVALYQALLDLTNPWTVMCIAAHPDDEDGTSLIVMRRKYGAHTVSLFSTFGEGGQNAIGPELYEEMGAIRARETMAAAEIQGSEPYFLGLKDFGFSKSADEAFKFWGHDEALRRMVLQIRELRPDVIITNHNSTSGHGHHQATGRLELEAFDAAADPKRFPEQLKGGVTTWQVQRLFLRVGFGNRLPEQNGGTVTIDPNERDPIRGTVFAEEALRALQKHATQGPWPKTFAEFAARFRAFSGQSAAQGQLPLIRYSLVREAKGAGALTKESHNFLDGLRLPKSIASQIVPPTIDGRPLAEHTDNRSLVFDQLQQYWKNVQDSYVSYVNSHQSYFNSYQGEANDSLRFLLVIQRVERALALAAAIDFSINRDVTGTPISAADLSVKISNRTNQTVRVNGCFSCGRDQVCRIDPPAIPWSLRQSFGQNPVGKNYRVLPGADISGSAKFQVPDELPVNLPLSRHLYQTNALGFEINTLCSIQVNDALFTLRGSTRVYVAWPVEIVEVTPSPAILTDGQISHRAGAARKKMRFTVRVVNRQTVPFDGTVIAASGITHERMDQIGLRVAAGESKTVTVMVQEPKELDSRSTIDFMLQSAKISSPSQIVPVIYADARVASNLRVGYIRGFDYSLPNALNALGVESKELSVDEVKTADLQKYTSIIVDNRVYESQPELIAANQKLLDYANAGGTLIVFYHKSNEWNPDERRNRPQQLAPYKLILGGERITDESAPIALLEPQHPLLNFPNKIGQGDFKDWIQERGLYYPREWDPQYHALLQSNDPGEAPLKGGLLVADYGRGHYIYSSMVWYRELRGGVPGAYRMLANMISYGQAEGKSKK